MRLQVRVILVCTLGLGLWFLADGVRCLVTGRFFGQQIPPEQVGRFKNALQVGASEFVDYGAWAAYVVQLGMDPHALAPFFVVLGLVALLGLFLFLQARPVGWAMLVAFAVTSSLKVGASSVVSVVLLAVLMLPATRRLLAWRLRRADRGGGAPFRPIGAQASTMRPPTTTSFTLLTPHS